MSHDGNIRLRRVHEPLAQGVAIIRVLRLVRYGIIIVADCRAPVDMVSELRAMTLRLRLLNDPRVHDLPRGKVGEHIEEV